MIERVASRRQSVARRGRAVAERSADSLALERTSFENVQRQLGIRQDYAAEPDAVGPSVTYGSLSHVGQELLQICIAGSDDQEVWKLLLQAAADIHLPRDSRQRIL